MIEHKGYRIEFIDGGLNNVDRWYVYRGTKLLTWWAMLSQAIDYINSLET